MNTRTARRATAGIVAALTVLAAVPASAANSTYRVNEHEEQDLHFDEWEYCEEQDAWIQAVGSIRRHWSLVVDSETDEVVAGHRTAHFTMTLSLPGSDTTATVRGDRNVSWDDRTGDFSASGGLTRVRFPNGGTFNVEVGHFTYDGETDVERMRGIDWRGIEPVCDRLAG